MLPIDDMRIATTLGLASAALFALASCGGDDGTRGDAGPGVDAGADMSARYDGGADGGAPTDSGTDAADGGIVDASPDATADAAVDAMLSCTPPSLDAEPAAPVAYAMITPSPTGGDIVAGHWVLTELLYQTTFPSGSAGTAKWVLDTAAETTDGGIASTVGFIDVTTPIAARADIASAGHYALATSQLTLTDECGGTSPFVMSGYSATRTTLIVWFDAALLPLTTSYQATFELR